MKKVFLAILAIVATISIASCGDGATSKTEITDSTVVQVDSTVTDSTVTDSTTVDTTVK